MPILNRFRGQRVAAVAPVAQQTVTTTTTTAPVIGREKLVSHAVVPGQRIKEVDVVSRKKVPYYQERELYEGPAQYEVINGGAREYASATTTATNGRLIGHQTLPGQRIKEVDVVSRKKVPYYEERQVYEGPAQMQVINGGQREYASATSTATGGRLIGHQTLPGQRIKEVDVVSRKKVPYYEERQVYEGPAQMQVINGGQREYASATSTATGGRLIGHQTLPGQRIKEVDVISRKKIPYYEQRELYEGPAQLQVINGGEREYVSATSTAKGGRLIGHKTLPGQRIKEVDVVSRKKVPYYQERELYEGPAQYQVINGGQREYVSATSTATNGRLIGSRKLPGQRIKEVDVVSRKKVPYYQERELYEGPAQYEVINGGAREYVSATSTATNGRLIGARKLPGARVKEVDVVSRKKVPYYMEKELYEGPASFEVIQGPVREYYRGSTNVAAANLSGASFTSTGSSIGSTGFVHRRRFGSGLLHRLRRPRYYQTSSVGSLGSVGSVSSVGSASSFSSGHSVYSLSGSSLSSGSLGSVGHHGYRASRILDRFRTRRHFKTAGIAAAQGLEGGKTMTAPAHGAYRAPTVSTRRVPIRDRVKSKVLRRPVVTKYY